MNENTRTENVFRNVVYSVISQIIMLVLQFALRTVFIKTLGVQYLGINGLFTNVLTILSFAEMGLGNAIIFSMYKPISDKDTEKLKTLMSFYKKMYKYVFIIVLVIGISLIPFLGQLVGPQEVPGNIVVYYLFFLSNTALSYLWIYKASIINADQKSYLVVVYQQIFMLIQVGIQIIILILTQNYLNYLIIQIIMVIATNFFISKRADKLYPFLKDNNVKPMTKEDSSTISTNVKSLMLYKFGSVVLNGTDNIIVSMLLGLANVGVLSNYVLILNSVNSLLQKVTESFSASIGNLNITKDRDKQENVFFQFLFINFWFYGIITVGFIVLVNPFISLWIGESYTFGMFFVITIGINFYLDGVRAPSYIYRTTLGLFKQGRMAPIIAAISNIFLSFYLGDKLGITGVILATIIVRFFVILLIDNILVRKSIGLSLLKYYIHFFRYVIILSIATIISYYIVNLINPVDILKLLLSGVVVFVIVNICLYVSTCYFKEFKKLKEIILKKIRRN